MRNLNVLRCDWAEGEVVRPGRPVQNDSNGLAYAVTADGHGLAAFGEGAPGVVDLGPRRARALAFLALHGSVVVGCSDGTLLRCLPNGEVRDEGSCDDGVLAMAPSPDQELLVVLAGDADGGGPVQLIGLSLDLEPVFECAAEQEQFGAAAPTDVGWGSADTQFRGRAGKRGGADGGGVAAAVPRLDDDGQPAVVWRGDGEYFAVSTLSPATGARW